MAADREEINRIIFDELVNGQDTSASDMVHSAADGVSDSVRSRSIVVTVALLAVIATLAKAAHKPLAPQHESGTFVDGGGPASTISGMKAEADAVLLVTYRGHRRTRYNNRSEAPPSSVYGFDVRAILRSHPALPTGRRLFRLELPGGNQETPLLARQTFVVGRQELIPGHRYVIFARLLGMRWIPTTGNDGGSGSIYDVTGDRAMSLSTHEWDNASPPSTSMFLEELRR